MMSKIKICDMSEQIRGVSYKPSDIHDTLNENSVILLRANNIFDGKINFDDVVYVDKSKVSEKQYLKKGDILICASSGSKQLVGKAASVNVDVECTFGAFCKVVRPINDVADYLGVYFQSDVYRRKISELSVGANINNIKNEHIDLLEIPAYNGILTDSFVDKIFKSQTIIEKRKQQLQQLDELVKARFVEMFGDPESNTKEWTKDILSNHLNVVGGYAFKSDLFLEDGIPVLRIGNINAGYFQSTNMVYWNHDNSLSRYMMYPGDLVMSLTGTVGKDDYGNVCILGDDYNCYYLNQRNAKLELFQSLNKYYLSQILKFSAVKKKLTGISRGVRQANISNKDILNLEIPIPPIELQNQFADFVEQVNKSKFVVQKALDEAQTLFDSLMQKYFG